MKNDKAISWMMSDIWNFISDLLLNGRTISRITIEYHTENSKSQTIYEARWYYNKVQKRKEVLNEN